MKRTAYAKAIDDVRESWIDELTDTSRDALHEQAVLVADAVRERGTGAVSDAVSDTEAIIQELYADIYEPVFVNLAEIVFQSYYQRSDSVGRSVPQRPYADFSFRQTIPDFLDRWIEAARRLLLSRPVQRRVKLVQQETIDEINRRVLIGLEEGLSVDRIADLIDGTEYGRPVEGRFPLVEPYSGPPVHDTTVRQRAQRIARTETMAAANSGGRQGVLDTGLDLRHFWIDIKGDNRTRDSHNTSLHPGLAEPRLMNEPYVLINKHGPVTLMFPSDPNAAGTERAVAGETILCRCVEGYEVI